MYQTCLSLSLSTQKRGVPAIKKMMSPSATPSARGRAMARPWEAGWTTAQPAIESAAGAVRASGGSASRSLPVQRINLLEAAVLDDEIFYSSRAHSRQQFLHRAEQGGYGAGAASSGVFFPASTFARCCAQRRAVFYRACKPTNAWSAVAERALP